MFYRKLMSLAALVTLCACSPSENPPAKPTSASAVKASPPAAPASAAAASQVEVDATAKLAPQNQAKWQLYQCDEGKAEVRYYQEKNEAAAQVKHNGATYTLTYSPELSEDDLSTFSNGHQSWTIAKFAGDFYHENDGFLVMHERPDPAASDLIVDNLLLQNCQPK